MSDAGGRRAARVRRRRPAVPHRLRGDAVAPAHDAGRAPRRRGHAGHPAARGGPGGRARRLLLHPGLGGDGGPHRRRRRAVRLARRAPPSATRRGPGTSSTCMGFLPAVQLAALASSWSGRCGPARTPREIAALQAAAAAADRVAGAAPGRRDPAHRAHARRRCPTTSAAACWPRATAHVNFAIVAAGENASSPAPPRVATADHQGRRGRAVRLRWLAVARGGRAGLLLGHDPHGLHRRAAPGVPGALRRAVRGPGHRGRGRPPSAPRPRTSTGPPAR